MPMGEALEVETIGLDPNQFQGRLGMATREPIDRRRLQALRKGPFTERRFAHIDVKRATRPRWSRKLLCSLVGGGCAMGKRREENRQGAKAEIEARSSGLGSQ